MSHRATNWAFEQRGLSASAWRILACLADRHNPDMGCFPSQEQLAIDAEMSRRSVNRQLDALEEMGLIRRVRRWCAASRQNLSTRYILGFENAFLLEPCATVAHGPCAIHDQSRVPERHTNLVNEPVTTAARDDGSDGSVAASGSSGDLFGHSSDAECLAVAGPGLSKKARRDMSTSRHVVDGWLEAGYDLHLDILPVIRQRTATKRKSIIRSWDYFSGAIRDAHARRARSVAASASSAEKMRRGEDGVLSMLAGRINAGQYVVASSISNRQCEQLVNRGLCTVDHLRSRGII